MYAERELNRYEEMEEGYDDDDEVNPYNQRPGHFGGDYNDGMFDEEDGEYDEFNKYEEDEIDPEEAQRRIME